MPTPDDLDKLQASVVAEALTVPRETSERQIGRAMRAVPVHLPLGILSRQVCRNCGGPVTYATRRLAERVLEAAGWSFRWRMCGGMARLIADACLSS